MRADVHTIGYVRVSTERQAGETVTSLRDQEAAITALAQRLGRDVGAWYRDEGVSGSIAEARPAFGGLLAFCRAHPRPTRAPGFVLLLNASRFGRFDDPDQAAALRYELRTLGWQVRFVESDDAEDVVARSVMRAVGDAQATEYRRNIIRNAQRGKRGTAQKGFWTNAAPLGYRRMVVHPPDRVRVLDTGVCKAPDEKIKLTLGPDDEVAVVRWAFEAYATGAHTMGELADVLRRRVPQRQWTKCGVKAMLTRETYLGRTVVGKRNAQLWRQKIWWTDPATWIRIEDTHPAIIDADLFNRVQAKLRGNGRRRPRADYRLSGLVHCAQCGRPYVGGGVGGTQRTGDARPRFYRCSGAVNDRAHPGVPHCPGKVGTIMKHVLEDAVIGLLVRELEHGTMRAAIRRATTERVRAHTRQADRPRDLAGPRRALAKAEAQRDRLIEAIAQGLPMTEAKPALDQARLAIEGARRELDAATSRPLDRAALDREADRWLQLADAFPQLMSRVTTAELREMLDVWLAGATFDKDTRELRVQMRTIPVALLADIPPRPDFRSKHVAGVIERRLSLTQTNRGKIIDVAARLAGRRFA